MDRDPGALAELLARTGGRRATPVIVAGGEVMVGFDPGRLRKALGLS